MSHAHHHYVDGTMVIMHADGSAITPAECVECRFPGASTEAVATEWGSCATCDSDRDDCTCEPKQPEPERCNATWNGNRCSLLAGHKDSRTGGHETIGTEERVLDAIWSDRASDSKPHVPAREEKSKPASGKCQHCARDADNYFLARCKDCWIDLRENVIASRDADVKRLTKERDETRTKGEELWNQRASIIQALGLADDIDMGRDLVEAAKSLRISHNAAHDTIASMHEACRVATKERDEWKRCAEATGEQCRVAEAHIGQQREEISNIRKERDEALLEAASWKDTAERVGKNLTAEVEKLRGELDGVWAVVDRALRVLTTLGNVVALFRRERDEACAENEQLRAQLATMKAEMIRLVGGA